jgi:hypothetical protein
MTVICKHKELLVELLIYWFFINKEFNHKYTNEMVIDIEAQNEDGQWYINYYLNDYGN